MKRISNADLIELVDERRRAGEIIIDCSHDKDGIWYNIRENVEMSKKDADKVIKQWEKEQQPETYEDRFLKKVGIKRDKDGIPDIVGKVMGDYHNSLRKAHGILEKPIIRPYCVKCKQIIDLQQVYTTQQLKGSTTILYYHSKCHLLKGTTSSEKDWNGNI